MKSFFKATTSEIDLSIFVSASSDDERKISETKAQKTLKKRSPKVKSTNEPPPTKTKLKRIQKRSFIESESDEENSNESKRIKSQPLGDNSPTIEPEVKDSLSPQSNSVKTPVIVYIFFSPLYF